MTQSRAQGVRKARQKKDRIQASSYHNTSRSPPILTPGSSPSLLETPLPQTQDAFHGTAGHMSPDLQFLDVFDVSSANNANFNNHDAIEEFGHFDASPLQYQIISLNNSPYIDERISLSPEQSPLSQSSLAMSWTQVPSFGRPTSSDRGRAPSQDNQARNTNEPSFHGSPQSSVSPNGEQSGQYVNQFGNSTFGYNTLETQYFNPNFTTMVTSSETLRPRLATDALLFDDNNFPTYSFSYPQQHQWTPVAQNPSPNFSAAATNVGFVSNEGHFLASPPPQHILGSSPGTFDTRQQTNYGDVPSEFNLNLQAGTPSPFMEYDDWIPPSVPSSSYALSHNSPASDDSAGSRESPNISDNHQHAHVIDPEAGFIKPKGRQRNLTAKEKKDARDVRDAKACWACHISKTKCSPCSPGNPCAQCARLVGKRRFCRFECFNHPLETLFTFMVPDYSMSRFQESEVASLLSMVAWTEQKLRIRLSWGYCHSLEVDCVKIQLRNQQSNLLAYQHQVLPNGQNKPTLMRKPSPPLGVPQEAINAMQLVNERYVAKIVETGLKQYVLDGAYNDDDSELPKRLLGTICNFYQRCLLAGEECELLRQTIEMHITSTILQRSLNLAPESVGEVQAHLRQAIPDRVVPKCAARQVKLSFFTMQRLRIQTILKDWGALMWAIHNASNNAERWSITFSVFIMLVLVVDKTLGAAHSLCESRIEYRGAGAKEERAEFRKLVRFTETELFDRCKEIFHWKFKTRKGGKEACNPIRDGMLAFKGRPCTKSITHLVHELQTLARDFDPEIRNHRTLPLSVADDVPYTDIGRLACVFLDDFLENT